MDVIRLDSQTLMELLEVLVFFLLFAAAGVIIVLFCALHLRFLVFCAIDEVKFVDLVTTKEREVVLLALVVHAVELGERTLSTDNLSVTKQSPDLA